MASFKKINFSIIFNFIGVLLLINAFFMFGCVLVSLYFDEAEYKGLLLAAIITLFFGLLFYRKTKNASKNVGIREGYLIVSLGWIGMIIFGCLPYFFTINLLPQEVQQVNHINFTNAIFETMSGYTTTGATILNDIEIMPKGLIFWRSLTQWIGGMGIIVLTVAILPLLGIGGMQLFIAEAPGVGADKLHPRITDTAKRLWIIYFMLTIIQTFLLKVFGMNWFDSLNHSLTSMSSGGFSTKNDSLAHWNQHPMIQYTVAFFMLLSGTNFVLIYYLFKRNFKKIWQNEEFKYYIGLIVVVSLIATFIIHFYANPIHNRIENFNLIQTPHGSIHYSLESSFRMALISVISVVTTTGFVNADFTNWTPFITVIFFALLFTGACSGSTSGGVKIVRHVMLMKNSYNEFRRILHPSAIIPVRFNHVSIPSKVVYNILAFFMIYMLVFIFGSIIMALLDTTSTPNTADVISSLSVTAASLGNVGPALGNYDPLSNFAHMAEPAKWFSAFLMLLGRLELFTILILFTPAFWKK